MAIANPRIHIICGICGCNKKFEFKIGEGFDDDTGETFPKVNIYCGNCSSLTGLDELMEERDQKRTKCE